MPAASCFLSLSSPRPIYPSPPLLPPRHSRRAVQTTLRTKKTKKTTRTTKTTRHDTRCPIRFEYGAGGTTLLSLPFHLRIWHAGECRHTASSLLLIIIFYLVSPHFLIAALCRAVPHCSLSLSLSAGWLLLFSRGCKRLSCTRLQWPIIISLAAARVCSLTNPPPPCKLLVTDTASSSPTCYSAPLRSTITTTRRPVLCCAALPLCPKLAIAAHRHLPARSSCPTTTSVWRAGTRGPLTFTCSRSLTPVSSLLLHSTVIHHAWTRRPPRFALDPSSAIYSTLVGLFLANSKN
jgi:hypothetical protein